VPPFSGGGALSFLLDMGQPLRSLASHDLALLCERVPPRFTVHSRTMTRTDCRKRMRSQSLEFRLELNKDKQVMANDRR